MSGGRITLPATVPSPERTQADHEHRILDLERRRPRRARMPNVSLEDSLNGVFLDHTATPDTQRIEFGTALLVPINNGGDLDPDVFELSGTGPWDSIGILQPGTYWGETRMGWYQDWGQVRINLQYEHSNGETYPVSDTYGLSQSLPTDQEGLYLGFGGLPHDQIAVARRGVIFVDEFAFTSAGTVDVFATVTNAVDRTPGGGDQTGVELALIQLSDSSDSDPPAIA